MRNDNKVCGLLHGFAVFSSVLVLFLSTILIGVEAIGKGEAEEKSGFDLTVNEDLVTLHANDASLYEIIEELGKLMKFEVVGTIHEEEKVSADFDKLSLKDALKKLSTNYGYQADSVDDEDENSGHSSRITKIIILPKGKEKVLLKIKSNDPDMQEDQTAEPKRPEPFKFEFDPGKYMEGGEK